MQIFICAYEFLNPRRRDTIKKGSEPLHSLPFSEITFCISMRMHNLRRRLLSIALFGLYHDVACQIHKGHAGD
ncbi:unknown [Bacteroides sp. CAG:875]|nr:unknown [Bacteroides sp. CAG:875]